MMHGHSQRRPRRVNRRPVLLVIGAGLVAVLAAAVYVAWPGGDLDETSAIPGEVAGSGAPPDAGPPPSSGPIPAPIPGPTAAAIADPDPVVSAARWLTAYRTARFDDASATAWIDRIRPVVTNDLAQQYEGLREGGQGAGWEDFVRGRCISTVRDVGGVIPPEAPRSAERVYVQIAGTLSTACDRDVDERPDESLAATLTLSHGRDGLWRVSAQLF